MRITVGSTAAKHWGINRCEPLDDDIWYSEEPWVTLREDWKVIPLDILKLVPEEGYYATPDALYTIKCSHFAWDIKWEKTKNDILHMRHKGCKILPDLYKALKDYWVTVHGSKDFLSLSKDKSEFFNDYVTYKYDHDYLHTLVAYPKAPAYELCLKDNEDVLTDYNKFIKMSFKDQVRMFREEIVVIACERWMLHKDISWYEAYMLSLKKTITNLTKNWANDFMIEHLVHFVKPKYSEFEYMLETLKGDIKMTKVDMSVFEEFGYDEEGLNELIYEMCEGGFTDRFNDYGYEHLEQEGGGEGGGEYCYGVFKFKGKLYKAEYAYYSYEGNDYSEILSTLREVKPVEKLVTVYE